MKISKMTVTAAVAATAVAVAAGTASADPAPVVPNAPATAVAANTGYLGTDHGINYRTFLNDAGRTISTTVDAGTFAVSGDAVTLTDRSGAVVASIPLTYDFAGRRVSVAPVIADAGRTLTVIPGVEIHDAALQHIDSQQWFYNELNKAAPGIAIGAAIGTVLGLFAFGIGAIPGAAIGAIAGGVYVGGQPLIDSAFAFLAPR